MDVGMTTIAVFSIIVVVIAAISVATALYNKKNKRRILNSRDRDEDYRTTLIRAINDASQILAYAARSGTSLNASDIDAILAAQRAGDSITAEQEAAFWVSSSSISKTIAPVTLETIKSTTSTNGMSLAALAARNYRFRTLATLAALLLFQVYWLIGATVISDLKEIRVRLERMAEERVKGKAAFALLNDKDADYASKKSVLDADSDRWGNLLWIEKISAWADLEVLKNWNFLSRILIPKSQRPPPFLGSSTTKPDDSADDNSIKESDYFLWVFSPGNAEDIQTSQIVLTALLKYILPILYGALGASAYVVRNLADEIKGYTFSAGSTVRYELRYYLGAVTGLSIAWFTSDPKSAETAGVLQSLSPLAIAFLAGYSVELLFSFLDRFAAVFSSAQPKPVG
jgi:hypothetical protein